MFRSAITVCLVDVARNGPFVFHDGLADGIERAAALGFDAVEIFAPSAADIKVDEIKALQAKYSLDIAAVGTGAGAVLHGLTLVDPDPSKRQEANAFIHEMIDVGGQLHAPAILGSMQGKVADETARPQAMQWLAESVRAFGQRAGQFEVPFLIEPLNRYESNIFNFVGQTADWMRSEKCDNVMVLADLFHMNIEEVNMADAITAAAADIGHVHFADSNRMAVGGGHSDLESVVEALRTAGYDGYLSAEVFALPNPQAAAEQTIKAYRELIGDE
jgi:sugar phosphate isomerase/epimerase